MEPQEAIARLNDAYFSDSSHEHRVLTALKPVVEGLDSFCDVGASLGQFTRFAGQALSGADIISIEADPLRARELAVNVARWGADGRNRFRAFHGAATATPGTVTFQTTNSNVSGSLVLSNLPHLDAVAQAEVRWQAVSVPAIVLDDLYPDFAPAFIKMDIEGGELGALQGARGILARRRTILLIEFHDFVMVDGEPVSMPCRRLLSEMGYREVEFHGKSLFYTGSHSRFQLEWLRHQLLAPLKWIKRNLF